jgi:hypothetical protein
MISRYLIILSNFDIRKIFASTLLATALAHSNDDIYPHSDATVLHEPFLL